MSEPLNPPIVASSTFHFASEAETLRTVREREGHLYSRWDNPTVQAAEARVAELTGAERALAFGSGMAAVSSTLLCALRERPRLLCHTELYGGCVELVRDLLPRWGIEVTWFPTRGWEEVLAAAAPGTIGAVYAETPTNPTLSLIDLRRLAAESRRLGATSIVDNTFATPILQRPLELGIDVELHSATKYLGGHHDLLAGVVAGPAGFVEALWTHRKLLGGVLDPFPAYLLHRGLKTLELRVERQSETAARLAEWLLEHPAVGAVHYPGLASHPERAIAAAQMRAGGGMLAFEVAAGYEAAVRMGDALSAIKRAPSLGGTETTVTLPRSTSHVNLSEAELARAGIAPGLVRVSVGLEPFEALRGDLERALSV